jgi:ferredoxin
MKTTLYYFSGTGNSLKVVRSIAARLENSQLVPIPRAIQQKDIVADAEQVGFVFPMFFCGLPNIVSEFAQKIDLERVAYTFAVATRHSDPGIAMDQLESILQAKSKKLNAGFYVNMPGTYILKYNAGSEEKQKAIFAKAEKKISYIAEVVKRSGNEVEKYNAVFKLIGRLSYGAWLKGHRTADENFYTDENCNSCGICQNVCPVSNVKLVSGRPEWQHRCQQCLACIHWCPREAIQYGEKTANRQRYHHPDITVKDIIAQRGH